MAVKNLDERFTQLVATLSLKFKLEKIWEHINANARVWSGKKKILDNDCGLRGWRMEIRWLSKCCGGRGI